MLERMRNSKLVGTAGALVAATLMLALANPAKAALFIVDTKALDAGDLIPGDGKCEYVTIVPVGQRCTLRAAVQEANALPGADVILIPDGWHIVLTRAGRNEDNAATGDLDILDDVAIGSFAPPEAWPVVDGNGIDRVFHVLALGAEALPVLTISGLEITGGFAVAPGDENGGGILDSTGQGLDLANCRIHHNVAVRDGGGVRNEMGAGGTSTIDRCSLEHNMAGLSGTAVYNHGRMLITNSTVSENRELIPGFGSDTIHNRSFLTIRNSTLADNDNAALRSFDADPAPDGLVLRNVTVVGNGGGLSFLDPDSFVSPSIFNSILAHNSVYDCDLDAGVPDTFDNNNLDSDGTCGLAGVGSDLPNTDPMLGPLQLNGGTTRTMVPTIGSPVIEAGDATSGTTHSCESGDQRGASRPLDGDGVGGAGCDIGAVEVLPCFQPVHGVVTSAVFSAPTTLVACNTITVGPAVDIFSPGDVTFRTRDAVIFGNGFTVHAGGAFEVVRDPAAGSGITLP